MILWIDPGIRKLGYALIEPDLTIISADAIVLDVVDVVREDYRRRMGQMYGFFEDLLHIYPNITTVCIEKLYFTGRNQNNAEFVYGIRWALMMLFSFRDITLLEYTPIQLKKYITGNAAATKSLVSAVVQRLYKLDKAPHYHDTADALGLAYLASKVTQ